MPGPASALISLIASCIALGAQTQSAPALRRPVGADMPMQFVANAGQWDRAVGLAAVGGTTAAWIVGDGFVQRFERTARADAGAATGGAIVRTRFVGGAGKVRGAEPLPAKHSFLRGTRSWSAPAFAKAQLDHLLPGVDLAFHAAASGGLEYDLALAPGADLAAVVAECDGASGLAIAADGALAVEVPLPGG